MARQLQEMPNLQRDPGAVPLQAAPVPDVEVAPSHEQMQSWHFWYPSWDAWKFQRTLTYWISVMYLEGSLLFLTGAAFSLTAFVQGRQSELALVQTPYLVGGVCFTIGSYMGILEVMNVGESGSRFILCPCGQAWRQQRRMSVNWKPFLGYGSYLAGAIFYNVNTVAGFFSLTPSEDMYLDGMTALLGALGFCIGSLLECMINKVWHIRLTSGLWWLSVSNLVGSLGFLIAGVALFGKVDESQTKWVVDLPYLLGSAAFMIGALCTMWLWKCEQFGLGFIPEMNIRFEREEPQEFVLDMHAEYGCGRASAWQLPFLTMYLVSCCASVVNIGIVIFLPVAIQNQKDLGFQLLEASLNFALSHGVMLLGSIVHHVPTARPHNWLLIYMRVVLALYSLNSWINVFQHLRE
eukprot:TRINITY_DN1601_c0_g5_i1.p1 TRINITY_DN1601_c0_g5~~TRINITY_DN1601_c0_g5_i1.p1  ORF type:complete len:407 (-),score=57.77 TRINITY_DN1601_c0_g5_i1:274-1494(-)